MQDRFQSTAAGFDAPASHAFPIAPSDATDLSETTRAIYCGAGGDIAATLTSGATVIFIGLATGQVLPIRATRVLATGTTATNMIGLV
ncbi:hypothetical protein [Devosia sp. 2618]|uniref:spike base protein, RCAP_Rcc01079 family n=1 Tax=Devosia sp. 2618 TaxID=3156454 RepID=UPI0033927B4D